jgi:hypothetical protein
MRNSVNSADQRPTNGCRFEEVYREFGDFSQLGVQKMTDPT